MVKNDTIHGCLLCIMALTAVSCGVEYLPANPAKEKSPTEPGIFQLDGCQLKASFYRAQKDGFVVAINFINAVNNGHMKMAGLQINIRELKSAERKYNLQEISLHHSRRHGLQSRIEVLKDSAVNVSLEPGNNYALYYTYRFEGTEKPGKRFMATVESVYENDGKQRHVKDSVVFRKSLYFYTN